jgi:hypothetical protein
MWLDITSPQDILPFSSQGVITCKILKIDESLAIKRYTRLKKKSTMSRGEEGAAVFKTISRSVDGSSTRSVHNEENDDEDDEDGHPHIQQQSSHNSVHSNNGNRRPVQQENNVQKPQTSSTPAPAPAPKPAPDVDLLGGDAEENPKPLHSVRKNHDAAATTTTTAGTSAPPKAAPAPPVEVADMFHFDAPPAKTSSTRSTSSGVGAGGGASMDIDEGAATSGKGTNGLTREQLAAQREAAIEKKVKEALEFKQEVLL